MYEDFIAFSWLILSFLMTLLLISISEKMFNTKKEWNICWKGTDSKYKIGKIFKWLAQMPTSTYKGIIQDNIIEVNKISNVVQYEILKMLKRIHSLYYKHIFLVIIIFIFKIINLCLNVFQMIISNIFASISYFAFSSEVVGRFFKFICIPQYNISKGFTLVHILNNNDYSDIMSISNSIDVIGITIFMLFFAILVYIGVFGLCINKFNGIKKYLIIIISSLLAIYFLYFSWKTMPITFIIIIVYLIGDAFHLYLKMILFPKK